MNLEEKSYQVKSIAQRLGFEFCGIARAEKLDDDARRLESWLNNNLHADMYYMENHFDKRVDPRLLVPGTKSIITVLKNYFPEKTRTNDAPKIAKYAWGKDYHEIIRPLLHQFLAEMRKIFGNIQGRGFVDSAPVLERSWAQKSGLGWIGKNTMLINKGVGSFYFIATLMVDIDLAYDTPLARDYCGTCTKCLDSCPTQAILPNKKVDANKCISYLTIELKDLLIPQKYEKHFDNWMFGCDVCNDVCPWNRFAQPHSEPLLAPLQAVLTFDFKDWLQLSEEIFRKEFKHSPLKRSKYAGIMRNLKFLPKGAS